MGCNCLNNEKSQIALKYAKMVEKNTGVKQAIYLNKATQTVHYGALNSVKKMNVAYFTTDEVKHEPKPKKSK